MIDQAEEDGSYKMLDGQDIGSIRTLKSKYDGDSIQVTAKGGQTFRLPCSTVIQMVNEFDFELQKKRVHTHLVRAILKPETES